MSRGVFSFSVAVLGTLGTVGFRLGSTRDRLPPEDRSACAAAACASADRGVKTFAEARLADSDVKLRAPASEPPPEVLLLLLPLPGSGAIGRYEVEGASGDTSSSNEELDSGDDMLCRFRDTARG